MLFCNHTQPVCDVYMPAVATFPKRIYAIITPANLGIPVIGKILPLAGALPVPTTLSGMKKFNKAVSQRIREGYALVVYPEAHVWPYCTDIRPFPATSFAYAVENHVATYCMTTTYQRRLFGEKPRATYYFDGPFFVDETLPKKQAREKLRDEVYACMKKRSQNSTYEYVHYEPADKDANAARTCERPAHGDASAIPVQPTQPFLPLEKKEVPA